MEDKLPIYEVIIDLDDNSEMGMQVVSFVDFPAIETDFLSFEKQELIKLAVQDEDKHLCYGPIALANKPIYRRTEEGFEYYIVFTPDNIEKMLQKYMKENKGNNVDENHSFELQDGVTLYQVFIKDTAKGINPTDFPEAEDGSLFGIYHVENEELWADVKDGKVKGFSLAGLFDMKKVENATFNKNNKPENNTKKMSKLSKVKEMLKAMLEVFGDVSTDKGTLIYDGDDEIKVGDAVKLLDGEGNEVDAEDGDYETDDQRIIVVADGKVTEIKDKEVEEPSNEETPEEDVNASTQEPEESVSKQKFNAVKLAFELTYEEKYNKIYEAIKALGLEYFYIVQAADDFAVVASYEEDTEKLYKFDLTWNNDEVTASNQTEVRVEYVPVAEEPESNEEEAPAEEEKPAEEEASVDLSAQAQFAALDKEPVKATKINKKLEEMRLRGYKL